MAAGNTKDASSSKSAKAKDAFVLDQGPADHATGLDEKIEQRRAHEEAAKKALFGYALVDIVNDPPYWRQWNKRNLNEAQSQALLQSFLVSGCDRFNPKYSISIIVKKGYVAEESYSSNLELREELPVLKLKSKLPPQYQLKGASGQHRAHAMVLWVDMQQTELNRLRKDANKIENRPASGLTPEEIKEYNEQIRPRIHRLEGTLKLKGCWLAFLYDEDILPKRTVMSMARNEIRHEYKETPEEGLVQLYSEMMLIENPGLRSPVHPQVTKGTPWKQYELLCMDYTRKVVQYFIEGGDHFMNERHFRLGRFHDEMLSSYGGILAYYVIKLEERLRLCFNDVDFSEAQFADLYDRLKDKATRQEAVTEAKAVLRSLKRAQPLDNTLTINHRNSLDEVFVKHFGELTSVSHRIADSSCSEYATAFAQYQADVQTKLNAVTKTLEETNALSLFSNVEQQAIRQAPAKARLIMHPDLGNPMLDFSDLPFMTKSFYSILKRNFRSIENAIREVSLWWSPYVALAAAHPRSWMPGSPSADMIRAIMGYPAFQSGERHDAVSEILHTFLDSYGQYIHLEGELSQIDIPTRPLKQIELAKLFGCNDEEEKAHKSNGAKAAKKGRGKSKKQNVEAEEDEYGEHIPIGDEGSDEEDMPIGISKTEQAKRTEERNKRKALLANRKTAINSEVATAAGILQASPKPEGNLAVLFDQPWSRSSKLSSRVPPDQFRGQETLAFHTYEWNNKFGSSRGRHLENIARIVIFEQAVVNYYRKPLLLNPESAAPSIRFLMEQLTRQYIITQHAGSVQSLLGPTGLQLPQLPSFVWPDRLCYDESAVYVRYQLEEELIRAKQVVARAHQAKELQNVINTLMNSRITWDDDYGLAEAREPPPLDEDIFNALQRLISAAQVNAYRQRFPEKARQITRQMTIPADEKLLVSYRGSATKSGVKLKHSSGKSQFELLSQEEVKLDVTKPSSRDDPQVGEQNDAEDNGGDDRDDSLRNGNEDVSSAGEGDSPTNGGVDQTTPCDDSANAREEDNDPRAAAIVQPGLVPVPAQLSWKRPPKRAAPDLISSHDKPVRSSSTNNKKRRKRTPNDEQIEVSESEIVIGNAHQFV
ncbi:hypothetical protein J3R83DRAFT_7739 [Lanmaoa asiatica]|nr:hypothetical protein J3R83DRAFT_7739 [Lanmaoa asiatica]